MSLFKEQISRRSLLLGVFALSACGFEPVFQAGGQSNLAHLHGKVKLPDAPSRELYEIRNQLGRYFGEPVDPIYELRISYRSVAASLAIPQNRHITKQRLTAKGRYIAREINSREVIMDIEFRKTSNYSTGSDRFNNDETLDQAKIALARSVADDFAIKFVSALKA